VCGRGIVFDCGTDRSIGYFAWALALLAPFAKKQLGATLRGVTNDERDATVDVLRTVTVPLLKRFGIEDNLELRIVRRGCPPLGGGEVVFNCPNVRATLPVDLADVGMIKRIRGVAYSSRVSPQMANRMVEAARSVVNAFIPDVYIYTDHFKGPDAGLSPGYGISLVAVSDTGALTSAEACAIGASLPEDIGLACANLLCEDIARSGYVDTAHQSIALILMAFGPEDVSRIRLGALSEHAIATLRHIKSFTGVAFKLVPDRDSGTIVASCLGSGYVNYAKRTL
jgi:RNA 3'-terminal phosphate cyclase-like protein